MEFEQSIINAQNIIEKIEKGGITLEQSLKLYDDCKKILTSCKEKLDNAEFLVTVN